MDKLIITCAINGSRITREQTPYIPVTPEEIIDSAVEAYRAGAAVVHIHVRDRQTHLGIQDISLFRAVSEGIRDRCDVVQCLTTSGIPGRNLSENERMATLAMILGGHPRVGLEDSVYYSAGVLAKSNAELVERIVRIAKEMGQEIATPDEARGLS